VIGFTAYGLWPARKEPAARRRIFISIGVAWLVQATSGAAFGITSLYFYGKFPDIHGIAVIALIIKMVCVATGLLISVVIVKRGFGAGREKFTTPLAGQFALGAVALSAAAFLRWFS
jgi:hypothetical protein